MSLNIIFAGTPDFAARHLAALIASEHNVVAAYSQPDRPAGRGKKLQASAVKQLAQTHDIPVYQPQSLKTTEAQATLANLNADLMVVVAYGLLLPQVILDTPKKGCINVHGSILPRWRGAAPIQRAIWAGDKETGVTIMQMDIGLDTGDMLHTQTLPISATDTSASLYDKLANIGPTALIDCIAEIEKGTIKAEKQDESLANYAAKLSKAEAQIDWHFSAAQLVRNIHAFNPWPMAFFELSVETEKGIVQHSIKVIDAQVITEDSNFVVGQIVSADKSGLQVQTSSGILNITKMQLPGKKPLLVAEILNSRQDWFKTGTQL